jgi:uncharacterized membrane protein
MWRVVLALGACGPIPDWKTPDSTPGGGADSQPGPDECAGLTWKSVGAPFVQTWCVQCHSVAVKGDDRNDAPNSVNFDTRDLVAAQADLIDFVLDGKGPEMPPKGQAAPSAKEIETFLLWLDCGAPQ